MLYGFYTPNDNAMSTRTDNHSGRQGWDWTSTEDRSLLEMIRCGYSAFDAAHALHRKVTDVVSRIGAIEPEMGAAGDELAELALPFHPGGEEHLVLLDLALSGLPLFEALLWCAGHPQRASACEIEAMRNAPQCLHILEFAFEHGLWCSWDSADEFAALDLLMTQAAGPVRAAVQALLDAFDAPSPRAVARCLLTGLMPQPAGVIAQPRPARRSGARNYRRGRGGRRGKSRSPSYPTGQPFPDTRTPAERAWESRTTWS